MCLGFERIPEFTSAHNSLDLQVWFVSLESLKFCNFCANQTHKIIKICQFCFPRDYYGYSLNIMFSRFPNHYCPFPMVFPHVSPSVSSVSLGVSPQCFPCLFFQILQVITILFSLSKDGRKTCFISFHRKYLSLFNIPKNDAIVLSKITFFTRYSLFCICLLRYQRIAYRNFFTLLKIILRAVIRRYIH